MHLDYLTGLTPTLMAIVGDSLSETEQILWLMPSLILAVGIGFGYWFHHILVANRAAGFYRRAEEELQKARHEADLILRDGQLKARDAVLQAKEAFEVENTSRRQALTAIEERLSARELNMDRRVALIDKKEAQIDVVVAEGEALRADIEQREAALSAKALEWDKRIEQAAAMTQEQAASVLFKKVEDDIQGDVAVRIRHAQEEAQRGSEKIARDIITTAIERYAADQVSEITTTAIMLGSEDMKGRIIGREGRNIRSLEAATGCNILIDESPETVVISGFDPYRREVARRALERLLHDGRIHPARIEEIVAEVQSELDDIVRQAGEAAIYELELSGIAPPLVRTLGLLKFRHSYSQSVLQHSIETAHIMGMMAVELGLDQKIARRVGLFHDIGKAIDHHFEGGHAMIGADLLKRNGETPVVYNAVASHHHDAEGESPYAALASAADAITAARPGARQETTEIYLKRLKQMETIANGFRGVKTSYAVYAGRELRVLVQPGKINDAEAALLARNICKQIEEQVKYPGQIKVTVIRETRCTEFAR